MSTNGHLKFQGTNRATFVGETSNIMFDTTTTSLGIGVTGTNHPSSNLYITGNAYISNSISVGGVLTMGTVNVVARHDLEAVTAMGNTTPLTIEFQNADTSLVTTGNVEVGNELIVTGNVSDLNVVSNVNMLHTANTASIKLNSNVVTEFPRSKKLIKYPRVNLTQNALNNGYAAAASSENTAATRYAFKAFNSNLNDEWQMSGVNNDPNEGYNITSPFDANSNSPTISVVNGGSYTGAWIKIQLPDAIRVLKVRMYLEDANSSRRPDKAVVLGSNDDTNWYDLSGEFLIAFGSSGWANVDINSAVAYYKYIKLLVTSLASEIGVTTGQLQLRELEYYGVPEYDPEAYGTDVVVKSVPNVPNMDWLEVYYDAKNYTNGVVQDETSNDIDATIGAATTFDSVNKAWSFSGASNRDGTEFVSGYLPSDFEGNQLHSVSMWLKFDYWHEGAFCIIGKETRTNSDSHKAIHFQFQDTSSARPRILYDFWSNQKSFYLPDDVQPGKWLHMTATYTGNAALRKMFVNGQELTAFTTNSNYATELALDTTNDLVVRLGSRYPVNSLYIFHGDIANFRLFNRALTTDEIYQLYAYQKEYFGHGDLGMTLKAGRLGIGTSEPRAALDVRGDVNFHSLLASANGGIETQITDQGIGYKVHSFTSTGTSQITVDKAGFFECLVVAGGGAGGSQNAAGGGGGGVVIQRVFVHTGTYDVVVGAGNTSGTRNPGLPSNRNYSEYPTGNRGGNSSVFGLLAIGGGNGAGDDYCGVDGGSGGGCSDDHYVIPGRGIQNQEGSNGYGNRGGYARINNKGGSGGGGAGEVGFDIDPDYDYGAANTTWFLLGRDGGNGVGSTIRTGTIQYYGGGGGGAQRTTADTDVPGAGIGGKGGGGNGASANGTGSAGTDNTGGGGGGSSSTSNGGNGGSGIVVVRYKI